MNLLTAALEDAEATLYDKDSHTILRGKMCIIHMAAYSATNGLGALNEEQMDQTERSIYITPLYDSIVVTVRCTRVALEERILEMAKSVTRRKASSDANIKWGNGVPGCGKTTWDMKHSLRNGEGRYHHHNTKSRKKPQRKAG
ncbi:hypothetical protein EVAR_93842_1 [Eumeta japonica]|uniref:Uncharacterized protein n=1 Tax=Eumeta variegata TaxID=151549 RepID=A0A4C1TWN0_EUMVA|nr:hypothetical protein EVAR_93842_1 [Eumeta japonica]